MNGFEERAEVALRETHLERIHELVDEYPDRLRFSVSLTDVAEEDPDIIDDICRSPTRAQEAFEAAVQSIGPTLGEGAGLAAVEVGFTDLPEERVMTVGDERASDLFTLIGLEGQITKRTEVAPKLSVGVFQCFACGHEMRREQGYAKIIEPFQCEACERKSTLVLKKRRSEWIDHQLVQLQQPPEDAIDGATSKINIHLEGDICGRIEGGNRLVFSGTFEPQENKKKTRHKRLLLGSDFEFKNELRNPDVSEWKDEIESVAASRDPFARLVDSFAPGHKGDRHIKSAILLLLFAGWSRTYNGRRYRGDSHMLIIGDPGVGKTGLFHAAAKAAPRVAMTDGTGSSSAGLTAAITKDSFGDEQFTIEAGTMVRANGGVAIVDEIDKGDTSDLDALHTALETQEVHVTKAGRNAHLPAETSLLAAGNPLGGHFDPREEFVDQIDLKSPLLSRFDLIYTMKEVVQEDAVWEIADHVVESRYESGRRDHGEDLEDEETMDAEFSPEFLTAYISYASELKPLPRDRQVREMMKDYYSRLKSSLPNRYTDLDDGEHSVSGLPVTVRKLDGLQRLSEASAKARLSEEINEGDVQRAMRHINRSLADIGIEPDGETPIGKTPDSISVEGVGI